jgi:hypothetical protein
METDISLAPPFVSRLIDFYLLGSASPLILFLCRRFPLERKHLLSRAGFIF